MRILILANNDVGLYQFRKELIEELLKENEVIISLPYGKLVEPLVEMGCKFIQTNIDRRGINPIKDMGLYRKYRKILKSEKPDLVITYTIKPNVYGGVACRLEKIPYAINITGLGTAFENEGLLKKIVVIMNRIACKKAKVVFFENEENRQIYINERIVNEEQTYRLNGAGVNLEKYCVLKYPEDGTIYFLFVGRIMKEKGVDELFSAMKRLVEEGFDCKLNMLGEFEEDYEEVINNYEKEGWLNFYGYQEDVRPFIEKSHCFVLPSWHEGMANTNLENAASGRPVITTDIHGCLEAVVNGKTGFLVKKRDEEDLYHTMMKFIKLSYEQKINMGLAGRRHMEEVFDKSKVIEETVKEIDKI